MKKIGIVCEYNPFHLGHKYQIDKIREMYKDSIIISLCSSTFTQRGDVSIINKLGVKPYIFNVKVNRIPVINSNIG